ncbi:MAG: GNAT family N-acetyltransferase [Myxococcota bacterium]
MSVSLDVRPLERLVPDLELRQGRYLLRFARTLEDVDRALRLRFEIFNRELGEGLAESWRTQRDADEFDAICDHLLVEDVASSELVGTYRMQTAAMAAAGRGFYSDREFALDSLPREIRAGSVELGRACVARPHRHGRALLALWRGIAEYVRLTGQRFLFGCCSLTSQSPAEGWALHAELMRRGALHPQLSVTARAGFRCPRPDAGDPITAPAAPPLLDMYLRAGARVASEPALDREFGTVDFLVLLDIAALPEGAIARALGHGR